MNRRQAIRDELTSIFASHRTARYIHLVQEVKPISEGVAVIRSAVGMVPPGQNDINPSVNAIQSTVAVLQDGRWLIILFQNTPAAFHGRPQLVEQMSTELRKALLANGPL